jgi:cysteine desulfurase
MKPLYLDNAATTHISNEVLEEMKKSLSNFGNTEAKYYCYAEDAKEDIKLARERIATGLGCNSDEVVFTSGATEANNLFIQGMVSAHPNKKRIIISSIEHSSIRETAYHFIEKGYEVIEIPADKYGLIDTDFLDDAINENTLFVSIILVNNEIGTIQDLKKIDEICIKHKVKLHVDATQAIGKIEINMSLFNSLEYLTCTSHKIYGPKGIGALIVRKKDGLKNDLKPITFGGEQEDGYRPGTLSNLLIVGFGKVGVKVVF